VCAEVESQTVDDQTREYLDRLLAETGDARRELEEKFEKNTDRLLTVLDRHSKQLDDLRSEYYALRAGLTRVEETIIRTELAIVRLEREVQENHPSYDEVRAEIRELRAQLVAAEERLSQIEASTRRDHDA